MQILRFGQMGDSGHGDFATKIEDFATRKDDVEMSHLGFELDQGDENYHNINTHDDDERVTKDGDDAFAYEDNNGSNIPQKKRKNSNPFTGLNRGELDRIAENLEEEYQIGYMRPMRPPSYRRYVPLRSNELFTRLVALYTPLFISLWAYFKHACLPDQQMTTCTDRPAFLATCYISSWLWDLHVSVRSSVAQLSGTAFNLYFQTQVHHIADRYDPFLQHLNSIIRPTHITMGLEDALYIPLVSIDNDWAYHGNSIAGITNHEVDTSITMAILQVIDSPGISWSTVPLSTTLLGRPGWLFDYRLDKAYAWFPVEPNFSRTDLIAPYILGIPCTPRLGPRDIDDWQFFPGGTLPQNLNPLSYLRYTERCFYGSAEYRTLEHEQYTIDLNQLLQASSQASEAREPPANPDDATIFTAYRYRLVDWCCHAKVVDGTAQQTRNKALRNFLQRGGTTEHR